MERGVGGAQETKGQGLSKVWGVPLPPVHVIFFFFLLTLSSPPVLPLCTKQEDPTSATPVSALSLHPQSPKCHSPRTLGFRLNIGWTHILFSGGLWGVRTSCVVVLVHEISHGGCWRVYEVVRTFTQPALDRVNVLCLCPSWDPITGEKMGLNHGSSVILVLQILPRFWLSVPGSSRISRLPLQRSHQCVE